ncbi:MAG TPA: phosphatidylglycerophosphatase A [Dinghuibacter sp.]|jgi:phosphatidylglycerophosphatase A|uniref:phosphatidylglycerophosphatase A family protein n=1 Tax=Dinghuibacter sp. TaxID=2024697 RepID=UPI002BE60999|nr:phosphatidylglycerophosphatase A [Dinghuibacter sp.]HTJ12269.1 phosphatidylglycerophosphatase A [Dinghuibacter sp.]
MSNATPSNAGARLLGLQRFIGSVAGIGYVGKGGGTLAAAVAALPLLLLTNNDAVRWIWLPIVTVVLTILGIWSGNGVEAEWGKDSSKVVMDEVVGMYVAILFHPLNWSTILAALVLFRIFDIWKPLGIRRTEALPGGWGVMIDDVVAGIYASVVLIALEWICKI